MDLSQWLLTRADADDQLDENAKLAVLASLEGESELDDALGGRFARPDSAPSLHDNEPEPARAFLESISVTGFRGIGPTSTLTLNPGPGLVVVAGRNGSGKSTFAEALEVAITGSTYRGAKNLSLWRENWRNIHQAEPCAIEVRVAIEGRGRTAIGVEWSPGADLDDRRIWTQGQGEKREPGIDALAWNRPLELYRPLLSYDELSGMLEGTPSRLHDALESFLGLEQLTDALDRLTVRAKLLREPQRRVKTARDAVRPALEALDDERARTVLAQVKKRAPDLDAVRRVLAGSVSVDPAVDRLAAVARVAIPDVDDVIKAADELADAWTFRIETTEQISEESVERLSLLEHALRLHERVGDVACPVCEIGALDARWAAHAAAHVTAAGADQRRLADSRRRLEAAEATVGRVIGIAIDLSGLDGLGLQAALAAIEALIAWRDAPTDPALLVEHLRVRYPQLAAAVDELQSEAVIEHARRQDKWAEIVIPLSRWIDAWKEADSVAPALSTAELAEAWIKTNLAELRNQRLEPLAERSRAIWAQLRQESNVDLGSIRLEGANTRRRVDLKARVDGSDAGALAVMSQGELHALALSLFIPRAASAESPFGFIMLDDPIQAMDPSKVDGFVNVLIELAKDRQVIVLSHDDRLPESLRRSRANARLLEISRGAGSVVSMANGSDPAQRYLEDARAVARDSGLSNVDKARVVPGLCRMSVEALCRDRFFADRIGAGASRAEVEGEWQSTPKTRDRVMLVIQPSSGNLDSWLDAKPWRRRGLGICTSAAHGGLYGDALAAVEDVKRCVDDLRAHR